MLRSLLYFLYAIFLCFHNKTVKVSLSAKVRPSTQFGKHVKVGMRTWINGEIGSCTYVGANCQLSADIGKYCSIAQNVRTISSFHPVDRISTSPVFYSPEGQCGTSYVEEKQYIDECYYDNKRRIAVQIGNDVWIGENVLIKGGVRIGDGAVIGMGAVVTKDVEPYTICAGVPAKVIRKRFENDIIQYLERIRWWDRDEEWLKSHLSIFQSQTIEINELMTLE